VRRWLHVNPLRTVEEEAAIYRIAVPELDRGSVR
jgi:hypothetical protein